MGIEELYKRHGSERDQLADATSISDVYTREFGTELTRWESQLLRQFQEKVSARRYRYRGFVRHTRDITLVLLTPSPWLMDGEFIFFDRDRELPPDGAYIEVVGSSVVAPRPLEESQTITRAIAAETWTRLPIDFISDIPPPMNLNDLSNLLFEYVGMAEASKRVFSRLFVSSPPFQDSIGGLTMGIQAIASQTQVRRLLSFIRQVLPPAMKGHQPSFRSVQGIRVRAPRFWRFDVGSFSINKMQQICVQRQDPAGYQEVSLGALTETETAFLPDIPLAISTEDFWIETRNPSHLRLPILKSAITFQMLTPEITKRSIDAGTEHVLTRLDALRESFGFEERVLARGHLLDADALGRPLSTLKLARSTARAYWKDTVTAKDIRYAWDRVLEPALKEFIELTELKDSAEKDWGKESQIDKFNTKVLKAIKKLDTGKRGFLGPTLNEIAEEAGVERHVAAETLARMKDGNILYEPRPGHYRLV
ncbi:MAG: hypothetical protein ACFFDQ_02155 [Candidatus Thorarchaeota archaeon]